MIEDFISSKNDSNDILKNWQCVIIKNFDVRINHREKDCL